MRATEIKTWLGIDSQLRSVYEDGVLRYPQVIIAEYSSNWWFYFEITKDIDLSGATPALSIKILPGSCVCVDYESNKMGDVRYPYEKESAILKHCRLPNHTELDFYEHIADI